MQYEVAIGGRTRRLLVQRAGELWRVTLDGTPLLVQAAPIDDQTLSLLVGAVGAGPPVRSIRAVVVPGRAAGDLDVHINGRCVAAAVRRDCRNRGGFDTRICDGLRRRGTLA